MVSWTVRILRWWKAYHRQCGEIAVSSALFNIKCYLFLVSQVPPRYCYLIIISSLLNWLIQPVEILVHKKWSFPLRIYSIYVTKSAVSGMENLINGRVNGKIHFLCKHFGTKLIDSTSWELESHSSKATGAIQNEKQRNLKILPAIVTVKLVLWVHTTKTN